MSRHLDDRQLLAYVENDLPARRREQIEAHVRSCPTCRARLERLGQTVRHLSDTLQETGANTPLSPARSWQAVSRRLEEQHPKPLVSVLHPYLRYAARLIAIVILGGFAAGIASLAHQTLVTTDTASNGPTPQVTADPSAFPGPLPGHLTDRSTPVSILILGVDGERAASNTTDMLMLLHIDAETGRAFLLSIPRNLYVEVDGHGKQRAGDIYAMGAQEQNGDGLTLTRETIAATLGLPIDHAVLLRFEGFVTLIDTIGGIDVDVPHAINDPLFPDGSGGYDPLSIAAGQQHMDGALALRYARTRATPTKGFDRSFRQQQIVLATKDRVMQLDMLPDLIAQSKTLWTAVSDSVESDLSLSRAIELALLAPSLSVDGVATASLDECCTKEHTTSEGQRVLLPRQGEIENLVQSLLEEK